NQLQTSAPTPQKSSSSVSKKEIGLGQNSFSGVTQSSKKSRIGYSYFSGDFLYHSSPESNFQFFTDLGGMQSLDQKDFHYLRVSEMYFDGYVSENFIISAGRKKLAPSTLEKNWNLGVVEPVFEWNPFRPERTGLVHVGVKAENKNLAFQFSYLPFFIPDQGANCQIKDGQFEQTNPWFRPPPNQVVFLDEPAETQFSIVMPEVKDVVNQRGYFTSFGGKVDFGSYFDVFYTNKPMNQALLSIDGKFSHVSGKVPISLTPQFVRHELSGGEIGHRFQKAKISFSLIQEKIQRPEIDNDVTTQVFHDAVYLSPSVSVMVEKIYLTASYLNRQSSETTLEGEFAESLPATLLPPRMPFKNASLLSAKWKYIGLQWISDLDNKSDLVSGDLSWLFANGIKTTFSFDLISFPEKNETSRDFFAVTGRENRSGLGVEYVF
ncbi:MAG: hypothetical protein AB7O96_06550, partial [Pseudobdellovibrionaceae bacterium]